MSSNHSNVDKQLELVQKTYNLQTTKLTTNQENSSQRQSSIGKVSIHQPSRKNSVHDIHQVTKDDLNKILVDIQENLSRFKVLLETINSVETIRDDFFKLRDHLFKKITEFISKLSNESGKRASISSKLNSSNVIIYHPQYLVYCIEYFRNELVRSQYLFCSLTSSGPIGSSTLDNIQIKSIDNSFVDQITHSNDQNYQDINQIKKDINHLEEHIYVLNQRYYSQIPDWHPLDETSGMRGSVGLNVYRSRFGMLNHKLSTTSSTGSHENSNICMRIYRKCAIICCMCQPNYI